MDRRIRDRRSELGDRRWFFPAAICNRGKSLPFTTREPDFVPTNTTVRRKTDSQVKNKAMGGR